MILTNFVSNPTWVDFPHRSIPSNTMNEPRLEVVDKAFADVNTDIRTSPKFVLRLM